VIRAIHHVGIVVKQLSEAYRLYRDVLRLPLVKEADVADQGVRAALLAAGDSEIELLEPLGPASGVGRFLARHGEGLHHVCFETPEVARDLAAIAARRPFTPGARFSSSGRTSRRTQLRVNFGSALLASSRQPRPCILR
jgi:methylmalonyl-CoA epimerase